MLNKEEIIQLHNNFKVEREEKIMGKIPFVIRSFTMADELAFADVFNSFDEKTTDEVLQNKLTKAILELALVSFNGKPVTKTQIKRFSPQKSNLMVNKFKELSSDIADYLEEFPEKELVTEEVEEFVLTDEINRNIKFSGEEEDIPPLKFSYKVLNLIEHEEVSEKVQETIDNIIEEREEETIKVIYSDTLRDIEYARHIITSIDDRELNEDFINFIGTELITFILNRSNKLQDQLLKIMQDPKAMGEEIKN